MKHLCQTLDRLSFLQVSKRACLIQGHLHGEALIVYIGDCRAINIEQNKGAMVSDDAAPLAVNLLQMLPAQPAIAI